METIPARYAPFDLDPTRHLCRERALIGALLWGEDDRLAQVLDIVRVSDFEREDARFALRGIEAINQPGMSMSDRRMALLSWMLANVGSLSSPRSDGEFSLWLLSLDMPEACTALALAHARGVRDRSIVRMAKKSGEAIAEESEHVPTAPHAILEEYLEDAEGRFASLRQRTDDSQTELHRTPASGLVDASLALRNTLKVGLIDLDARVPVDSTDLILIAARPSVGKTALALQIALNVARENKRVLVVSLEMKREALAARWIANVGDIDHQHVRLGAYSSPEELERARTAEAAVCCLPLSVSDRGMDRVESVHALVEREKIARGIDMLVVDYIQLMRVRGRHDNRVQEVSAVSRALKLIAMEFRVPVFALSQLSRGCEEGQRPALHHLRDSGALEQDADVALMLWDDNEENVLHVHIAKNRNGSTGDLNLFFDRPTQRISNLAKGPDVEFIP